MRATSRQRDLLLVVAGTLLFLGAWEIAGRTEALGRTWVPFTDIVSAVFADVNRSLLTRSFTATITKAAQGFVIGVSAAFLFAACAATVTTLRQGLSRLALTLSALPWVALGPLLVITFPAEVAPVVIAALAVFFQAFVAISAGLDAASPQHYDVFRVYGAGRFARLLRLQLPGSVPYVFLGLKLAAPAAILGAIFGEWFGVDRGLGVVLLSSMQNFRVDVLWAAALLAALTSMCAYGLFAFLEWAWKQRVGTLSTAAGGGRRGGWDAATSTRARIVSTALGLGIPLVLVIVWASWSLSTDTSGILIPSPGETISSMLSSGFYFDDAVITLKFAIAGLALGVFTGLAIAIASWWLPLMRGVLTPLVLVARSVPILALLPVLGGLIGYNEKTEIAIAALISFFPAFVFATTGLRSLPPGSADVAAGIGTSRMRFFRRIALPAALPSLTVALRISAGLSLVAAVVAEFLLGQAGLGQLFARSFDRLEMDDAWGVAVTIVLMSLAAYALATWLERAVLNRMS